MQRASFFEDDRYAVGGNPGRGCPGTSYMDGRAVADPWAGRFRRASTHRRVVYTRARRGTPGSPPKPPFRGLAHRANHPMTHRLAGEMSGRLCGAGSCPQLLCPGRTRAGALAVSTTRVWVAHPTVLILVLQHSLTPITEPSSCAGIHRALYVGPTLDFIVECHLCFYSLRKYGIIRHEGATYYD